MLILTRKIGQSISINGTIRITVQAIRGRQVRLGIEAPAAIPVLRQELLPHPQPAAPARGISLEKLRATKFTSLTSANRVAARAGKSRAGG